jgi:hypothetical protein
VCAARAALRRSEGRHRDRSAWADPVGEGTADPSLHAGDPPVHRPRQGHSRARCQHGRVHHGLDDGHLLRERGLLRPRGHDGEAAHRRRVERPRRRHLPRGRPRRTRCDAAQPHRPHGTNGRRAGVRQGRRRCRTVLRRGGLPSGGGVRHQRRVLPGGRARHPETRGVGRGGAEPSRRIRTRTPSPTGNYSASTSTFWFPPRWTAS